MKLKHVVQSLALGAIALTGVGSAEATTFQIYNAGTTDIPTVPGTSNSYGGFLSVYNAPLTGSTLPAGPSFLSTAFYSILAGSNLTFDFPASTGALHANLDYLGSSGCGDLSNCTGTSPIRTDAVLESIFQNATYTMNGSNIVISAQVPVNTQIGTWENANNFGGVVTGRPLSNSPTLSLQLISATGDLNGNGNLDDDWVGEFNFFLAGGYGLLNADGTNITTVVYPGAGGRLTFNATGNFGGGTAVPEPATMTLLGAGLLGAAARRRRQTA